MQLLFLHYKRDCSVCACSVLRTCCLLKIFEPIVAPRATKASAKAKGSRHATPKMVKCKLPPTLAWSSSDHERVKSIVEHYVEIINYESSCESNCKFSRNYIMCLAHLFCYQESASTDFGAQSITKQHEDNVLWNELRCISIDLTHSFFEKFVAD